MKFNPQTYQPINYRTWVLEDKARQGINIKRLSILTSDELKVWNEAQKYQDARNDPGHGEMTAYFAIKLLPFNPNGIREIVVPTAICHDIGWYGDDPDAWNRLVQKAQKQGNLESLNSSDVRMPHQIKGAELIQTVFKKAHYPAKKYFQECADIIKDHDTRENPTTPSGRVVWDADYLWRVTLPCNQVYLFSNGIINPKEVLKRAEDCCLNTLSPHNLEGIAKQIARIEIANTIYYKFPEQAEEVFKQNYSKELEIVKRFYSNQ